MGLSASQARFLQLTARRNDNEYQAQQINQQRTTIADKMQEISMKYSNGINNRQLCFVVPTGDSSGDTYEKSAGIKVKSVRLTYDTITAEYPQGLGYQLIDQYGTPVRPNDKKAAAIREQALQDLTAAKAEQYFQVSNGKDEYVDVTGKNFMSTIGNAATVKNSNGETIETEQFAKNVHGMSAVQLHKYCSQMGYRFEANQGVESQNTPFIRTSVDDSKIEAAQQAYEAAMAEADAIENESAIYDDRCNDPKYLESQLRTGKWTLLKPTQDIDENGDIKYEQVNYSSVGNISDTLYTDDDASITAEYDAEMDYYQHKDKELELQLQQLETSHNAVQTEIDSVKKVIEKNVEKSFKTFG